MQPHYVNIDHRTIIIGAQLKEINDIDVRRRFILTVKDNLEFYWLNRCMTDYIIHSVFHHTFNMYFSAKEARIRSKQRD